jgi:predicted nucleic acid-binding protein
MLEKQREQVSTLAVSAITVMELMVGCRNKSELRKTERLLERFEVIALNEQASATATELIR